MIGFRQSHAAVIGIDTYRNGIPPLRTAVNDARQVSRVLEEDYGYSVHRLTDDVTLERLRVLFEETLPREVEEEDRLLVYFAGHGIALEGKDGPAGYLIPQDARGDARDSFLPMTELNGWLEGLACRHLLLILDCCFAGAFRWSSTRELGGPPEVIHSERFHRYIRDPARQLLTSAAYDQKALDVLCGETIGVRGRDPDQAEHSPFAAAFLRGLKGEADVVRRVGKGPPVGDGVITATELYFFLRDCVEVGAEGVNHRQTPGLWPLKWHDKGEFIHLVPGHKLDLPPAPSLDEASNPYRGLQPYDYNPEHSRLFFGRRRVIRALHRRIWRQPLTVVVGASGTGKSSVVKAGWMIWAGRIKRRGWYLLTPIRPGKDPLAALATLVLPWGSSATSSRMRADPDALARAVGFWAESEPNRRLVLVVDQLEELLTLCGDAAEREQFLVQLDRALAAHPDRLRVVLTLRSDFEPQFAHSPLQEKWLAARVVVPVMTLDEYREAIEGPASVNVLYFQGKASSQAFIDRLIGDVANTPGALPLLSFTLSELYRLYLVQGRRDRSLAEEDYEALGGVGGSLRNRADEIYNGLPDDAHRAAMRRIVLRMVSIEGGELARRRVSDDELRYESDAENDRVRAVRQRLIDARLIVPDKDVDDRPVVEPAHDELVRGWDKLLQWSREESENLQMRRRLSPAATAWSKRQGGLWLIEPRLGVLKQVLESPRNWLNADETRFVRRSLAVRRRVLFSSALAIVLAFVLISTAGLVAYRQRDIARDALEQGRIRLADGYLRGIGHTDGAIGDFERSGLQALAQERDERVRFLFFVRALAAQEPALRLCNRAEIATHCAVRFDREMREKVHHLVLEMLDHGSSPIAPAFAIRLACARIGMVLESQGMAEGDRFAALAARTFGESLGAKTTQTPLRTGDARFLVKLAPQLGPTEAGAIARHALELMVRDDSSFDSKPIYVQASEMLAGEVGPGPDYHSLSQVVAAMAPRLGPKEAAAVVRGIPELIRSQAIGSSLPDILSDVVASVAPKLASADAAAFARSSLSLLAQSVGATDSKAFASATSAVVPRVESKDAVAVSRDALELISKAEAGRLNCLPFFSRPLVILEPRRGPEAVARRVMRELPDTTVPYVLGSLFQAAVYAAPRLLSTEARAIAVKALEMIHGIDRSDGYHNDWEAIKATVAVVGAVTPRLEASDAEAVAFTAMKFTAQANLLQLETFSRMIATVASKLDEGTALAAKEEVAKRSRILSSDMSHDLTALRTNASIASLPALAAGYDLRWISPVEDVDGIPTEGKSLMVVAAVKGALHFRIFDGDGEMGVDTDETKLKTTAGAIEELRDQLESLRPPHELTESEKARVITAVISIVGLTLAADVTRACLNFIEGRDDDDGLQGISEVIAEVVPHLGPLEVAAIRPKVLDQAKDSGPHQLLVLARLVAGLTPKLSDPAKHESAAELARCATDRIARLEPSDDPQLPSQEPEDLLAITQAVTTVKPWLGKEKLRGASAAVMRKVSALLHDKEIDRYEELAQGAGEMAALLGPEDATNIAQGATNLIPVSDPVRLLCLSRMLLPQFDAAPRRKFASRVMKRATDLIPTTMDSKNSQALRRSVDVAAPVLDVDQLAQYLNGVTWTERFRVSVLAALSAKVRPIPATPLKTKWQLITWIETNRAHSEDADHLHSLIIESPGTESPSSPVRFRTLWPAGALVALVVLWLRTVSLPEVLGLLGRGAWFSAILMAVCGARVWGMISGPIFRWGDFALPSTIEKLILILLLFGVVALCFWIQAHVAWSPSGARSEQSRAEPND